MNRMPEKMKMTLSRGWGTWLLNIIEAESPIQRLRRAGASLKTVGVHIDAERLGEAVDWHVGGARWGLGWVEHHPTEPGWRVDFKFGVSQNQVDYGWSSKEGTCRRTQPGFHFEQRGRWCWSRRVLSTSQWNNLSQPDGRNPFTCPLVLKESQE